MHPWVYRRPPDYRAPATPWLLLWPKADLAVDANADALALTGQAAEVSLSTGTQTAALTLAGERASATLAKQVAALEQALALAEQQANVVLKLVGSFSMRDVPGWTPDPYGGVFRRGYQLRPARRSAFFPTVQTDGNIAATRWSLTLAGEPAAVQFVQTTRSWILTEAVRQRALRYAWQPLPLDTQPWDERVVQFRVDPSVLTAYADMLTISTQLAVARISRNVQTVLEQLSLTAPAAAVRVAKQIAATSAALTLAGQASRVGTGATILAIEDALALAGVDVVLELDRGISAQAGNLVIAELVASLGTDLNLAASVAALTIDGQTATVEVEGAISALAAELALAGVDAAVSLGGELDAGTAALSLAENAAQLDFERRVMAAVNSLAITHQQAIISGTQAVIVTVGQRTVRIRARRTTITVH